VAEHAPSKDDRNSMLVSRFACAEVPRGIAGTWKGTFHGQLIELKADGSYPETIDAFELKLTFERHRLTGTLNQRQRPQGAKRAFVA
jgi:hypothetical protein